MRSKQRTKASGMAVRNLRPALKKKGAIAFRAMLAGALAMGASGCLLHPILHPFGLFNHKSKNPPPLNVSEQPDKILYQRSLNEIQHGKYDTGRLTLQTLINTYPDSEYLAKAKLAIAESYYRQGGMAGLTQAQAEYKDFITFFPTAPEAPMAQYRAAMCNFKLMGKADRDLTEAREAQYEFREFLRDYPESPLMPQAKDRLREVQEVLAEGEFDIATFYLEIGANPAARSRLKQLAKEYPNFSQGDQVLWDLSETLQRLNQPKAAIPYYDRLVLEYPLSPLAPKAKEELASLHQPIPKPTLATLARARADQADMPRRHGWIQFPDLFAMMSGAPDLSATRHGPVILGSLDDMGMAELKKEEVKPATPPATNAGTGALSTKVVTASALKGGTAADPDHTLTATRKNAAPGKPAAQKKAETPAKPARKKHGMFHFLRKLF